MSIPAQATIVCITLSLSLQIAGQKNDSPLAPYVKEQAPVLVLEHVRVIDGTGAAPQARSRLSNPQSHPEHTHPAPKY
jgi:hypothetical protein